MSANMSVHSREEIASWAEDIRCQNANEKEYEKPIILSRHGGVYDVSVQYECPKCENDIIVEPGVEEINNIISECPICKGTRPVTTLFLSCD